MRKKKLFWQLYGISTVIVVIILSASTILLFDSFKGHLQAQVSEGLLSRAYLLYSEVLVYSDILASLDSINDDEPRQGAGSLQPAVDKLQLWCVDQGRRSRTRITIIRSDGTVLADSYQQPAAMKNHANRPEIMAALEDGTGTSTRFSVTLQETTMYAAIPLKKDGAIIGVLRPAVPLYQAENAFRAMRWKILGGALLLLVLIVIIGFIISRKFTRPIEELKQGARRFAEGDLEFRLPIPEYDEFRDLAEIMNHMASQLEDRIGFILQQNNQQNTVLSSMVEGVIAFDSDERLININKSAAHLLNVDGKKVQGKKVKKVLKNSGLKRFVRKALNSKARLEDYITLLDEKEKYLQVHGSPLNDAQGNVVGALIVLNDITKLRNLENVRRDFVANVSHELKTPITSIKGFVETLLDGAIADREDSIRFLNIISKQADRLNAIIEDLLSMSRIEQGAEREEIELTPGVVQDVLISAIQTCQVEAAAKHMDLRLDCDKQLVPEMNAQLLEQAVINLINNAIKYSEDGGNVYISCQETDNEMAICVRDEGQGIEAEHLPRLFERFYRIDKARSRKLGGTGLGLAIVKHIAQAHHGRIEVSSRIGIGSSFTLYLPVSQPVSSTVDERTASDKRTDADKQNVTESPSA